MEGGRLLLIILCIILVYEPGVSLVWRMAGWCSPSQEVKEEGVAREDGVPRDEGVAKEGGDKQAVINTITGQCLPKLVCQLYSLQNTETISDSERNLIALIGSSSLSGYSSKYNFAAHMGQLIRGVEGTGCYNFYPGCPFSGQEVMKVAKRIKFK